MASNNANAGAGDSGARQKIRSSTKKNAAHLNSRRPPFSQAPARADTFGARQAIQASAFLARRKNSTSGTFPRASAIPAGGAP